MTKGNRPSDGNRRPAQYRTNWDEKDRETSVPDSWVRLAERAHHTGSAETMIGDDHVLCVAGHLADLIVDQHPRLAGGPRLVRHDGVEVAIYVLNERRS